jgi:uncharacterized membrane protein
MHWLTRFLRHIFATQRQTHQCFPAAALARIEAAITASEIKHNGQIRFIVETALSPLALYEKQTAQQRALEIFSLFGVWDTENNNGVLLYLLMADRDFEIIADRQIHAKAGQAYWEQTCAEMQALLKEGQFEQGVLLGIQRISAMLEKHFPEDVITPNELPDKPLII